MHRLCAATKALINIPYTPSMASSWRALHCCTGWLLWAKRPLGGNYRSSSSFQPPISYKTVSYTWILKSALDLYLTTARRTSTLEVTQNVLGPPTKQEYNEIFFQFARDCARKKAVYFFQRDQKGLASSLFPRSSLPFFFVLANKFVDVTRTYSSQSSFVVTV